MLRFRAQPLRRQLFIAIALLLVPVFAAAVWSGWSTLTERENELRQQARIVGSAVAAYVDNDIAGLDRLAADVGMHPAVQAMDAAQVVQPLTDIASNRPLILDIALVSRDGTQIARVGKHPAVLTDLSSDTSLALSGGPRTVMPMKSAGDGTHFLCVGYPVHNRTGAAVGVLWFMISLQATQQTLSALPLPAESVVTITDESNVVLVRSLEPDQYVGRNLHNGAHFSDGRDWSIHTGVDRVRRMYIRQMIDRGPWVLSVGIPMRIALLNAADVWTRSLLILGLGLVGWTVVAVALSNRLSSSVQHLNGAAQRIAAGDFTQSAMHPMPSSELSDLQDAFASMLQRFNATRDELDRHLAEERRISQELQSLQRQVIRQERLAAVGQLVSGVAHEINNPLQAILGFAELLQMQSDVSDTVKADLRVIQKESARACAIIRNLALFARQQPGESTAMSLTEVVNAVVELRHRRLQTENIELTVEDRATRPVLATLAELQQVALNFLVNAEQALKLSGRVPGRITIRTYDAGDFVGLEVEDTGPGIPDADESKLFQPFFTTKPVGMGTGLGLSVSYGIIDSFGGRIGHRPAPAGGAIFYFELPIASLSA